MAAKKQPRKEPQKSASSPVVEQVAFALVDMSALPTTAAVRRTPRKVNKKLEIPRLCPGCSSPTNGMLLVARFEEKRTDTDEPDLEEEPPVNGTLCPVCRHDFDWKPGADPWIRVADECPLKIGADEHRRGDLVHIESPEDDMECVPATVTTDAGRAEPMGGLDSGWRKTHNYNLAELSGRIRT